MPTVSPGRDPTARTRGDHAGHEGDPVQRVVSDGEGLAFGAEQDLLVGDQPAQPYPVDPDAVHRRTAGSRQLLHGGVGWRGEVGGGTGGGDPPGGDSGRSGRGVGLVGMVQLDDLGALVERGRLRSEVHHQYRADGEVGRDQHPDRRLPGQHRPGAASRRSSVNPVVPTTTLMPCSMHQSEVVQHRVGMGEVDRNRGGLGRLPVIAQVERSDQLQTVGSLDGMAHLGAHPTPGTEHRDLDHRSPRRTRQNLSSAIAR